MNDEGRLEAGVAQLRGAVRSLVWIHGGERTCVAASVASLAYLLYGILSPNLLPDDFWNASLARWIGLGSGFGYAVLNLLHLAIYSSYDEQLTSASSAVDSYYAEQGFAEVPTEITELVGRYRRSLDPVFLQDRRGLRINVAAGAVWSVIALALSYAAR